MRIVYKAFDFILEAKDILLLPSYKGSTLRGGFGNAFRKVVCALKKADCSECILKEKCVYSYVFETPPPSDTKIMTKYTNAPHPFIIEPPQEKRQAYKPGDEITFGLTLIGRAVDYLPYFVYTFDELGRIGIGKDRGKYELKTVSCRGGFQTCPDAGEYNNTSAKSRGESLSAHEKDGIIYDSMTKTLKPFEKNILNLESPILNIQCNSPQPPSKIITPPSPPLILRGGREGLRGRAEGWGVMSLNLDFVTPTRIVYDSHLTLDLEFHMLIRQLLRRLSLLSYFHCNGDPSEIDFKGIIEKAKEVKTVKRDLKWYDWQRYSARQDTRMKMGGFVGEITFEGDIAPFMSLIKAGEVLHVGKGTSFGLGKYAMK